MLKQALTLAVLLQITSFSGNDDNTTFIVVIEPTNGASAITVAVSEGKPLNLICCLAACIVA